MNIFLKMFAKINDEIVKDMKPYLHKQDLDCNYIIESSGLKTELGFIPNYVIDSKLKQIIIPFKTNIEFPIYESKANPLPVTSLHYMRTNPIFDKINIQSTIKEIHLNDNIPCITGKLNGSHTYINLPRECEVLGKNALGTNLQVIRCYKRNSYLLNNYTRKKIVDSYDNV